MTINVFYINKYYYGMSLNEDSIHYNGIIRDETRGCVKQR